MKTKKMITKDEAISTIDVPIDELCKAADEIREQFCENVFDICTIINAKSGRCSEDCKYCAQSAFHCTNVEEYPLLDKETVVNAANRRIPPIDNTHPSFRIEKSTSSNQYLTLTFIFFKNKSSKIRRIDINYTICNFCSTLGNLL